MAKVQLADGQYLPARYEVCGRCRGEGKHTNPAIDEHGITAEEMHELGDDFRDDYLSGVYDVLCEQCKGEKVVLRPDKERCTDQQWAAYEAELEEMYQLRAEEEAERRAGC